MIALHAEASLSHGGQGESLVPPYTRGSVSLWLTDATYLNLVSDKKVLTVSRKVDECHAPAVAARVVKSFLVVSYVPTFRGFHSSTFRLNVSTFYVGYEGTVGGVSKTERDASACIRQ